MKTEIERELKYQLIETDFEKLQRYIESRNYKKKECIDQVNYYFDTKDYFFKRNKITMRLRKFAVDDMYELTIKVPKESNSEIITEHIKTKNEFTIKLKSEDAQKMLNNRIKDYIDLFIGISNTSILNEEKVIRGVNFIGELRTKRFNYVLEEDESALSLDISEYLDIRDYEVEWEAKDIESADCFLKNIFEKLDIKPFNNVQSKSTRFINKLIENIKLGACEIKKI